MSAFFRTLRVSPAFRINTARPLSTAAAASTTAAASAVARVSAGQQAALAVGSVGAWAVMLAGAPYWAPFAGDKFYRMRERVARMPKLRMPAGIRIPIPRVGSVRYVHIKMILDCS